MFRKMSQPPRSRRLPAAPSPAERAATWLSFACAVHCLLMPLALGVLPMLDVAHAAMGAEAETALTAMVTISALAGTIWGYRRHRDARIVLTAALGLGAYLLGHQRLEGSALGLTLAIGGALLLAASSFAGARLSRACAEPSCAH